MIFIHEIMTLPGIKYEDNIIHRTSIDDKDQYRFESPYEVEIQECTIINVSRKSDKCYILIDINETTAQEKLGEFINDVIKHTGINKTVCIKNILLSIPNGTRIDSKVGQNIMPLRDDPSLLTDINCNVTMEWRSYSTSTSTESEEMGLDFYLASILLNEPIPDPTAKHTDTNIVILDNSISPGLSTKIDDELNISYMIQ